MGISWGQLNDQLIASATEKRIPLMGQFELTSRCNLECKMCYICRAAGDKEVQRAEKTAGEWIRLGEEARDAGMLYLLLTGGEVFLRQDFKEIYEAFSHMGFCIELYTNATMITPEIAGWLGKQPPSRIGVTLYGASSQTYASVCGYADGYERAVRGVDLLLDHGMTLDLRTTVVRRNIKDFDALAAFAEKRRMDFGIVNYVSPPRPGGGTDPLNERLSPQELAAYEANIEDYFARRGETSAGILQGAECSRAEGPFGCSVGKCSFWVTWEGFMTTCGLTEEPRTRPFEKGFLEAWKELQAKCASIPACKECRTCVYREECLTCPARLKSETGFFDRPAQYLCELAKQRYKEGLK